MKKLLDGGLDPNARRRSPGGTTALMMAAPDAEKMTLLIDRGANVNARSETKYTALMVAAQYGIHSTPAIRLLLSRGADAGQSQGKPLFNADPLFLAAYSGNAEVLPDLLKAGASLNGRDDAHRDVELRCDFRRRAPRLPRRRERAGAARRARRSHRRAHHAARQSRPGRSGRDGQVPHLEGRRRRITWTATA